MNTHVSKATARLVAARDWLTVFQLPPYACELNPVESVWALLKRSLAALIKTRLRRMQLRAGLFDGFLTGTRLDLTPLRSLRN